MYEEAEENCIIRSFVLAFAKDYEVDGVCCISCRRRRKSTEIWWGNLKVRKILPCKRRNKWEDSVFGDLKEIE
jgi:hypothetical protein